MDTFKATDMPALTIAAQERLTQIERSYYNILSGHCQTYELSDPHGALDKIRTLATVFFDFYYSFYSQFPAYSEHWRLGSATKALERIKVPIDNFTATRNWVNQSIITTIQNTIVEHSRTSIQLQRIMPVADSSKVPSLGVASTDSPLRKMAKSIRFLDPVASRRKAFVQPLLDAKGWSIAQWAEKARVSRHTANSYLEGKRKTYHSSMKELSAALGVSFQDFPK